MEPEPKVERVVLVLPPRRRQPPPAKTPIGVLLRSDEGLRVLLDALRDGQHAP